MTSDLRRGIEGIAFLVGFTACIPAANWLVSNVGTVCIPDGPCLIPVAPGLAAPSGVLVVGLALVLRDLVQRRLRAASLSVGLAPRSLGRRQTEQERHLACRLRCGLAALDCADRASQDAETAPEQEMRNDRAPPLEVC